MASKASDGANSRPARPAAPPVIRQVPLSGNADQRLGLRLATACAISLLVNVLGLATFTLLAVFVFPNVNAGEAPKELTVIETKVEDDSKPPDLENDDEGINAEVPTNYNVSKIDNVSVPGPEHKDEAVSMPGAEGGPPVTVPPPAGLGSNVGAGGGIDAAIKGGRGSLAGPPGGFSASLMKPGGFGARLSGATREQMRKEGGGNTQSEAAVVLGLDWLARHQAPDGHWSLDGFRRDGHCNCTGPGQNQDIAATAFGLLPFLGAGHTHKAGASGSGKYRKHVERGLKYLLVKQRGDGDFASGPSEMYAHGLATIAICEAYGLTSDPVLKGPAQRALNFIARAQSAAGGWSYNAPCTGHDTSVGGWQLMALKSGQMAGLEVSPKTLAAAKRWLDEVGDPDGSGYGYTSKGSTPTMSAVGLLCREYTGWGPKHPGLQKGVQNLLKDYAPGKVGSMYYYYYATQVLHHFGGQPWKQWNIAMRDLLIRTQDKGRDRRHPDQKGSWGPAGDALGSAGGRVMITSMSLLTLEVYYRYLPLYRRDMGETKQ